MSNRPRRPTLRALTGPGAIYGERISEFEQGYDPEEVDAYITAIEQERDEAVDIIRAIRDSGALDDIDPPGSEWFDESQWAVNRRVLAFLAHFKGGSNG